MTTDLHARLDAIRAEMDKWYVTRAPLSLVKRIEGLGKERDLWKAQAEASAAAYC